MDAIAAARYWRFDCQLTRARTGSNAIAHVMIISGPFISQLLRLYIAAIFYNLDGIVAGSVRHQTRSCRNARQ